MYTMNLAGAIRRAYEAAERCWPEENVWIAPIPTDSGWWWGASSQAGGGSVFEGPPKGNIEDALDAFTAEVEKRADAA